MHSDKVPGLSVSFSGGYAFFSGSVDATMKSKVMYSIRMVTSCPDGTIVFSSCECPAGAGPHSTCKHVVAALLVVSYLKVNGTLLVRQSCTETIQSFHRPARLKQKMSPMKASSLGKGVNDSDDPRLVQKIC